MADVTMVERVARALAEARGGEAFFDDDWTRMVADYQQMCRQHPRYIRGRSLIADAFREARAAIAVMREPTKAMADAGETALESQMDEGMSSLEGGNVHTYTHLMYGAQSEVFRAMIDAALAEGEGG